MLLILPPSAPFRLQHSFRLATLCEAYSHNSKQGSCPFFLSVGLGRLHSSCQSGSRVHRLCPALATMSRHNEPARPSSRALRCRSEGLCPLPGTHVSSFLETHLGTCVAGDSFPTNETSPAKSVLMAWPFTSLFLQHKTSQNGVARSRILQRAHLYGVENYNCSNDP